MNITSCMNREEFILCKKFIRNHNCLSRQSTAHLAALGSETFSPFIDVLIFSPAALFSWENVRSSQFYPGPNLIYRSNQSASIKYLKFVVVLETFRMKENYQKEGNSKQKNRLMPESLSIYNFIYLIQFYIF